MSTIDLKIKPRNVEPLIDVLRATYQSFEEVAFEPIAIERGEVPATDDGTTCEQLAATARQAAATLIVTGRLVGPADELEHILRVYSAGHETGIEEMRTIVMVDDLWPRIVEAEMEAEMEAEAA